MSDSVVVWLAVALCLFWALGAYNRLIRLRSQGIVAFATLEGLCQQHLLLVRANCPAGDQAVASLEPGHAPDATLVAWAALEAAAEQFRASLKVAHAQPLNAPVMRALATALQTLALSWSRLRDLPPDLAGPALPAAFQSQWEHVALQVENARTEFNRRVLNYNEAIGQFPALLLAWLFGFKAAQPIWIE